MFSKSERFPEPKDDVPGPNTYQIDERRSQLPITFSTAKRFESPIGKDHHTIISMSSYAMDPESPSGKFSTPSKSARAEICGLKDEVEDLRHKLREESARKKSVLKDIESQTRQLQASEARMRVMEAKLKELAQSKHALASEKGACEKELLTLRAKWDSAARKLAKISETVARAQSKIASAEKERTLAQERVAQLLAELSSKQDVENKCIQLGDQLELANRQVEQLQLDLKATKDSFESQTERTTEETQSHLYSLACTISQLRSDLEVEMNYSTARKTELSLLQVEKRKLESLLKEAHDTHQTTITALENDRNAFAESATTTKEQLDMIKSEYDTLRQERDSQLASLNESMRVLQDEMAVKDSSLIEAQQMHTELEATYNALVDEQDNLTKEINSLHDDIKLRQVENRRLDERVHFLESAMDYLRGEINEKQEQLEELKMENAELHDRLLQQNGDVQSALAAQVQLKLSLEEADEKIAQLESAIVSLKLESEATRAQFESTLAAEKDVARTELENANTELESNRSQLEDARAELANMTETLNLVRVNAEQAQLAAKEDLEAVCVELEAEKQQLAHSKEKLAEKEATHEALLVAHEELKKAHDSLVASYESIQEDVLERDKKLEHAQNVEQQLETQNDALKQERDSLDAQRATLESQLENIVTELEASKSAVEAQREVVDTLQKEVEQMRQSAADGEARIRTLEESLTNSQIAMEKLTQTNLSLVEATQTLVQNVESLTETKLRLEQSLVDVEDEKQSIVKLSEEKLKDMQTASDEKVSALKTELSVALESALDLMTAKTELAEEHSNACNRIVELESKAEESAGEEARLLESQRQHVNHINDLQAQVRSAQSEFDAAQLEHEKQIRILEECHAGKLESEAYQHRLKLEELEKAHAEQLERVSANARDQIDASQETHYKQMESLHQTLAELKEEKEAEIQKSSSLAKDIADLTGQLSSAKHASGDLESQVCALKDEVESKKVELEKVSEKAAQASESSQQFEAKYIEMNESAKELSEKLSIANDTLAEMQVEKSRADSALAAARDEVKHHAESLAEMDSALASAQTEVESLTSEKTKLKREVEELKAEMARARKSNDVAMAHVQAEKKQWMELAESQKKEMEESSKLMRAAQDEVDAMRVKYDILKAQREEEDREMNDLRVKKLSHEVRMMTAELARQKTRVQTRETAIAAGKAREEKLQVNLDTQIEKCRDLQRQLADRDREAIIERGRAKSVGANNKANQEKEQANAEKKEDLTMPTLDEFNDVTTQLTIAKAEISRLNKQLEVEKSQIEGLIADQTKLTGHNNPKQKIQLTHRLMTENHELKLERANLLAQLEKKGFDSPHRKSLTRSLVARVRPGSTKIVTQDGGMENAGVNPLSFSTSAAPQPDHSLASKAGLMRIPTGENEENIAVGAHGRQHSN